MRRWWFVLWCALAPACASVSNSSSLAADLAADPRALKIFEGATGKPASWEDVLASCARSDVVFVGENHGHPLGLASAAALFEDLVAREPKASLSLEFWERDEQSRLDDYLSDVSDLATLEKRSGRTPGNFPPGHRAMIETAKKAQRPVHAANAPRQYVRIAHRKGYEPLTALTWEQQRLFRIPREFIGGRYRTDFDRVMTPDDRDPNAADERERLDNVYRSQQLWDWSMAESLYTSLTNGESPVVHVVGHFHTDFDGGTPQALELLRPGTKTTILSYSDRWSDELAADDKERADFVLYAGPTPGD